MEVQECQDQQGDGAEKYEGAELAPAGDFCSVDNAAREDIRESVEDADEAEKSGDCCTVR